MILNINIMYNTYILIRNKFMHCLFINVSKQISLIATQFVRENTDSLREPTGKITFYEVVTRVFKIVNELQ